MEYQKVAEATSNFIDNKITRKIHKEIIQNQLQMNMITK